MTPRPRRLHPAAVGAEALSGLRQLALPIIAIALVGSRGGTDALMFAFAGLLFAIGMAYVQWQTTRWFLEDDAVRLRRGVFTENVVTIPYDRVQAVDTVRGPVQRLFGVVELHVQSAGGGRQGEIVLKAVTEDEADALREAVRRGAGEATPADPLAAPEAAGIPKNVEGAAPSTVLGRSGSWSLGTRRLIVAAVTSGSLGVLLPVVAGASQVLDDLLGIEDAERLLPDTVGEGLLLAAVALGVAWVLSFLGTIVAFAGFSVVRDGERLRIRRGVLERREASVPVARVHALRVIESPLREPFGLAQVRIETAGYAKEAATAQTLLPIVRRREAEAVLRELLPELDAPLDAPEQVPARAARRYLLGPVVTAALVAGVLIAFFGPDALPALALLPVAAVVGWGRYRAAGVALLGDHVVLRGRTRTFARTTATADARRLQAVRSSVTPFQRRGHLATLAVDVSSGRRLAVAHVDAATTDTLVARLSTAATSPPPA
jgi:putative membrane protein